ncbi:MAG: site-specific integrase [Pseudomonadota bacterium]
MGISYREGRKKPWMVYWREAITDRQKSISFETEQEAKAFELSIKSKLRKHKQSPKIKEPKLFVEQIIRQYLSTLSSTPTAKQQTAYHAKHILNAFGRRQAIFLENSVVHAYIYQERERGLSQLTINRRLCILKSALRWAVECSLLPHNPLKDLRLSKGYAQRFAPPTPTEAHRILQVAAPHVARCILLGIWTGARVGPSELFRIRWEDVDLQLGIIRIWSAQKNRDKSYRDVPIRSSFMPILEKWQAEDSPKNMPWLIHWGTKPVKSISQAWHSALKKVGISRRIRPYDLRHAFATYALANGADIKALADIMGHQDVTMILKTYQHVQESQRRAAIEAIPDITIISNTKLKKF